MTTWFITRASRVFGRENLQAECSWRLAAGRGQPVAGPARGMAVAR
jgi:hypothetical protein